MRSLPWWLTYLATAFVVAVGVLTFWPLLESKCVYQSLCFEIAKGIPAAFVTLVIGGIAALVAWRQLEVARAKVKLDLFERRFAIFEKTWGFLSRVATEGPGPNAFTDFTNTIPEASFLFGSAVKDYLNLATAKRNALWGIETRMKANGNMMRPEDVPADLELVKWFHSEASEGCKRVFAPYLDFEAWR